MFGGCKNRDTRAPSRNFRGRKKGKSRVYFKRERHGYTYNKEGKEYEQGEEKEEEEKKRAMRLVVVCFSLFSRALYKAITGFIFFRR